MKGALNETRWQQPDDRLALTAPEEVGTCVKSIMRVEPFASDKQIGALLWIIEDAD